MNTEENEFNILSLKIWREATIYNSNKFPSVEYDGTHNKNLKSFKSLADYFSKSDRINRENISALMLKNNTIKSFNGIENFKTLSLIDVTNNPIAEITDTTLKYFENRIQNCPIEINSDGVISGNFCFKIQGTNFDKVKLFDLIENLNCLNSNSLNIDFFKNDVLGIYIYMKERSKNEWLYAENSRDLKKEYKTLEIYTQHKCKNNVANSSYWSKTLGTLKELKSGNGENHLKIWFDINPNEDGYRYYSGNLNIGYNFYKKIAIPDNSVYLNLIKSELNIDVNEIINNNKPVAKKWWQF
ncbi:hypothetical protein [Psychroserpens algicola]|uniref:hypothetical protein n=1 Tax=Psychroserpens algicola TaxID=1719034 RepID=UPI0019546E9B|nr:hypothetical protein [Psychroserpens algicola]